ncbi:hypothetical protein HPO96_27995 [Kribbella sandramycini]|uniref:Uncharacterized protein n=1 Tax=Kribbella sandramycini TaxID=60450 RepID=A0A7Y4L4A6_9ACTN|nr:hypothetical protein [Kribbella sandramycini]MBB6571444.1 hypothetical protein [Kribbella sandramycini]NOL44095.1 hypothetical protein [Kribbella sandramycini]
MAVFARVRTARRRRAAGAAVVAAAAAVAVFAVSGNLNDSKSEPPVLAPPPTPVQTTPPPYDVTVTLKPVVKGRTVTMNISATGTVLLPIAAGGLELPAQNLMALGQGSAYSWGDDSEPFSAFSNGTECVKAKTPYKGTGTVPADTHTYARPGIYIYTYRAKFCGMKESATATTQIQIK